MTFQNFSLKMPQKSIIELEIRELQIKKMSEINFECNMNGFQTVHLFNVLIITESLLELWNPRGYGNQKLYDLLIRYKGNIKF